jgi:pimeloyl-ACP methyl ester carboxylesterase
MKEVLSGDGTPIAFDRIGQGPPLILVEGALNDLATMLPLAALLQGQFTVFTYDRRGRGASGDSPQYSVDREIEDLERVIAETDGSPFVFANCSGGALVLEAAARGADIASMALYEPPFFLEGRSVPTDYSRRLSSLIEQGLRGEALKLFMLETVLLPAEHVSQVRNGPMWPSLEAMAHTLVYEDAVMADCSLPVDRLKQVTVPTLVIEGAQSPAWARESVQALVDVLPTGFRFPLAGHTHFLVPEAVVPLLRAFFGG